MADPWTPPAGALAAHFPHGKKPGDGIGWILDKLKSLEVQIRDMRSGILTNVQNVILPEMLTEQIGAEEDRAQAVQSAALSAGWNTLVTAEVEWPSWATRAIVDVMGAISLVEAASAPDVYGGALKIVTNGTESLETRCFGVYDHRDGGSDNTIGHVFDILTIDAPTETITATLDFYPWNEGWYLGDPDSTAKCHLFVVFLR